MVVLSKAGVYGLRAATYLAMQPSDEYVSIAKIADDLRISFHFLTKVLQSLTQANMLKSFRGPKGGVTFARPSAEISVYDVVVAIDTDNMFRECILSLPGCNERTPCPLHAEWLQIRTRVRTLFQETSLADMAAQVKTKKLRLSDIGLSELNS